MLKKLLLTAITFIASMGFAFAQVDVNKADQTALDGLKGIGPKLSKTILDERNKGGDFKDWADFEKRVKGVGDKNSVKLSQAGLTINGQAKGNAPAAAAKPAKAAQAVASDSASENKGAVKVKAEVQGSATTEKKVIAKDAKAVPASAPK